MNQHLTRKPRVVMTTLGSFGDVHPYIALALEMKARHISPVIVTGEAYREKIEALGIEFHPTRPEIPAMDSPEGIEMIDKIMDLRKGAEYLFRDLLIPAVRQSYTDLEMAMRGAEMLITHPITLAGPLVAQKTGIPWVSTVLAPASLWSDYDPFVPPTAPWLHGLLRLGGPRAASLFQRLFEGLTASWLQPFYEFQRELGLPQGENPLFAGQYSPQLNLGLFSSVLYRPQADWPVNTVLTGFPFYDRNGGSQLEPELQRFLDSGPAPIVFTLGSAAVHVAGDFFRESVAAAKMLKRRAVLLIGSERNRPAVPLPESIGVFNYAPYGELLPRAAAMVHQGGVGTTGQGLRAGIPMLVMPYNHDQPDNAARVTRLGVARTIKRSGYTAAKAATELKELLENPAYAQRASEAGRRVRAENGAAAAVELIAQKLREKRRKETAITAPLELSAVA